jgi:hypothetical protein
MEDQMGEIDHGVPGPRKLPRILHALIYLVLGTGFLASLYMVFVVFRTDCGWGPLGACARELPAELFLRRRLYALEAWVTFGFLALYFAHTTYRSKR